MSPEFSRVGHRVAGRDDGGVILVAGNRDASELIYLQPGFPDTHQALIPLAQSLARTGNCLVGVGCLPEYDQPGWRLVHGQSYTMDQVAEALAAGVEALLEQSSCGAEQVTLLVHDWGCVPGFMFSNQHAHKCKRVVSLDILAPPPKDQYPTDEAVRAAGARFPLAASAPVRCLRVLRLVLYQLYFGLVYMTLHLSATLALLLLWLGQKLLFAKYPVGWLLGPLSPNVAADAVALSQPLDPKKCYMYYAQWRSVLTGNTGWRKQFKLPAVGIPVLFLYGTQKQTFFHTAASLAALDARTDGSLHKSFKAGHWFYHEFHEEVLSSILAFLS